MPRDIELENKLMKYDLQPWICNTKYPELNFIVYGTIENLEKLDKFIINIQKNKNAPR